MHAFVISSHKLANLSSPDVLVIHPEKTIGIEEVRQIQAFLSRKPMQSPKNTVYLLDAHLLTLPAQNALLKTLEEPPATAEIYLVTNSPDLLLPTVLSRVQIIKSETEMPPLDQARLKKAESTYIRIATAKRGARLAVVDELNFAREQAMEFLDDLERLKHANLNLKINYPVLVQARKYLRANVNVKLTLDYLFLNC